MIVQLFLLLCSSLVTGYIHPLTSITAETATFSDIALQVDGKLVVSGVHNKNMSTSLLVNRYTTGGILDPTFNSTGTVELIVGTFSNGNSVQIQPDGKIVLGGVAIVSNKTQALVARYTSGGILDTTFGSGGVVTLEFGEGLNGARVLLNNDKILLVGTTVISGRAVALTAQYTSAGVLDTTFGTGGVVTTSFAFSVQLHSVGVQSNGKIVVGGSLGTRMFVFLRYNTNGTLDTSFGTNGISTVTLSSSTRLSHLQLYANDFIIACGRTSQHIVLVRLDADGSLDTTFGGNGIVETIFELGASAESLVIQSDMTILTSGFIGDEIAVLKYNNDGTLNTSFGQNGVVTYPSEAGGGLGIQTQLDDAIVTCGFDDQKGILLRFNPTGPIDRSFGIDGAVTFPVASPELNNNYLFAYTTGTQALTTSFGGITFDINGPIDGWVHTGGSSQFTCKATGNYLVSFTGLYTGSGLTVPNEIAFRATVNGTERAGSQITAHLASVELSRVLTRTIILPLMFDDVVVLEHKRNSMVGVINLEGIGDGDTPIGGTVTIQRIS